MDKSLYKVVLLAQMALGVILVKFLESLGIQDVSSIFVNVSVGLIAVWAAVKFYKVYLSKRVITQGDEQKDAEPTE